MEIQLVIYQSWVTQFEALVVWRQRFHAPPGQWARLEVLILHTFFGYNFTMCYSTASKLALDARIQGDLHCRHVYLGCQKPS